MIIPTKGSRGLPRDPDVEIETARVGRPASGGDAARRLRAVETRHAARAQSTRKLPLLGTGKPDPHSGQGETSLFGVSLWRADETKKARSSLL
jgi:hypothetical protein